MPKKNNLWPAFNALADRVAKGVTHVSGVSSDRIMSEDIYLLLKCVQDLDQRLRAVEGRWPK